MQKSKHNYVHICNINPIITPEQLKLLFPITHIEQKVIINTRETIINILRRDDPRLLVVCGPCSIHDTDAALDYADRLKSLSVKLQDQLYIIMRVYLEKPRTTVGWKGFLNDPYMNGSYDIVSGLKISRNLLIKLIQMELPLATEVLNINIPQYIGDLFSWSAIGARTSESQIHREAASGLCTPIGFKNSTNGNLSSAIDAICSAMVPHGYISINQIGQVCLLKTTGNPNGHIILRGGIYPNYYPNDIINCEQKIKKEGLLPALMIDCSHGNSNKSYRRQVDVVQSVVNQIKCGNRSIIGVMLESYINSGNQSVDLLNSKMKYGVSVTDECMDWRMTEHVLCYLHKELKPFLVSRVSGATMA